MSHLISGTAVSPCRRRGQECPSHKAMLTLDTVTVLGLGLGPSGCPAIEMCLLSWGIPPWGTIMCLHRLTLPGSWWPLHLQPSPGSGLSSGFSASSPGVDALVTGSLEARRRPQLRGSSPSGHSLVSGSGGILTGATPGPAAPRGLVWGS